MMRLYPQQLSKQLSDGLLGCYLVCGNDPLLLQESVDAIRHSAAQQDFLEHYTYSLDTSVDWEDIFSLSQAMSLFANRQTLTLIFPESGPNAAISDKLIQLISLLHDDLLLIIRGPKLTKAQENSKWFKALSERKTAYIQCLTPEAQYLPRWVSERAKSLNITLDDAANQLLCYCYEGNLLALSQALSRLALLYPDGKLTLPRVEEVVNSAAHFTPYHWLDAMLGGKTKRAWHILQQLELEGVEPIILLRTLQKELLLLLTINSQMNSTPLRTLFDQHRVWQNRRPMISDALQRLNRQSLQQAVSLLTRLEIILKQDYGQNVWQELRTLTLLVSGKTIPAGLVQ